ncbi:protein gamma response 1 [Vigna radiata var. radiata]|uniref:Protein gamma response 1 n=1 Tax=Vigna radiata var. radiata TaxID=3916 RepID=A0A1S3TF97_VIGRR|nr:protein gamma response 1 [Vigna radiata var. radiata]
MDEPEAVTAERLPHPPSPKLGFPPTDAGAANHVGGLSTILVASIQDAKDRIAQIEYVFCSQLYPQFKSDAASKRRRIDQLQREVDENMALHKNLVELVQSKVSALKDAEEKRNAAFSKLEDCESEKVKLLARIEELDEKLRRKTREVEEERALLERVEALTRELQDEKAKRNRVTEAYKRLKSQHVYLRRKVGLCEENVAEQKKFESGSEFGTRQSPVAEPVLASENPNIMGACEAAEMRNEIPLEDFGGLESKTPEVFVTGCEINEVKEKPSEEDRGTNLSSPSCGFRDVPKCPPTTKLVSVSSTKRPASSWRQTRTHQSRTGPDPHDDFLDTPLENIRGNLNKDFNKEDLPNPIQEDINNDSSDDETQDMAAKSSPQKKLKQYSINVVDQRSYKYVEPVRKKAERENLKGVECKQCRKFYDAVLPNADGKDADSKQNFRCEHLDGVSRHRYRYVPPLTPEGFWNIGFESEM